jgi:nitrogen-specific signal transduction histidine kinase
MPMLLIDGDQIQQVFMNIVINAADAMAKWWHLTVKTEVRDGRPRFLSRIQGAG